MKCPGVPIDIPVPQKLENLSADDILNPAPMRPFDMSACPDRQGRYDCFPTIHRPIIAAVDDAAAGLDLVQSLHELQVLMDAVRALALVMAGREMAGST